MKRPTDKERLDFVLKTWGIYMRIRSGQSSGLWTRIRNRRKLDAAMKQESMK